MEYICTQKNYTTQIYVVNSLLHCKMCQCGFSMYGEKKMEKEHKTLQSLQFLSIMQ